MTTYVNFASVTPTISTSNYAANDQIGGLMAFDFEQRVSTIRTVIVLDKEKQDTGLSLFLFSEAPTIASSDNAALDILDSEIISKCVGVITVDNSDYVDLANSGVAEKDVEVPVVSSKGMIWVVAMVNTQTPSFSTTDGITIRLGATS